MARQKQSRKSTRRNQPKVKRPPKWARVLAAEIDEATDEGGTIQAWDVQRIAPSLPPTEHTTMSGARLARLLGPEVLRALVIEHDWYEGILEDDEFNPRSNPNTASIKARCMRG